jgi:hypothetical protein
MEDYSGSFWTEDMLIHNHKSTMNVMMNRDKFPKAAPDAELWKTIEAIESALFIKFSGSTKTMLFLTGRK